MQKTDEEILKALEADADILRKAIQIRNRYSQEQSPAPTTAAVPKTESKKFAVLETLTGKRRTRKTANGVNLAKEIIDYVFSSEVPLRSFTVKKVFVAKYPNADVATLERRVTDVLAKVLPKDARFDSRRADRGKGNVYGRKEIIKKPHQ